MNQCRFWSLQLEKWNKGYVIYIVGLILFSTHSREYEMRHRGIRKDPIYYACFAPNKFVSLSITLSCNYLPLITFKFAFHIFLTRMYPYTYVPLHFQHSSADFFNIGLSLIDSTWHYQMFRHFGFHWPYLTSKGTMAQKYIYS